MNSNFSDDQKIWGMFAHLSAFFFFFVPLGNILGPLAIWLVKKKEFPFVEDQGKEALNFQLSFTLYAFIAALLIPVFIGIGLLIAVAIVDLVFTIVAGIKAKDGIYYRYPFTLTVIK